MHGPCLSVSETQNFFEHGISSVGYHLAFIAGKNVDLFTVLGFGRSRPRDLAVSLFAGRDAIRRVRSL